MPQTPEEYLNAIGLPEAVKKIHEILTEKHPVNGSEFDAWYTNREHVLRNLEGLGRLTAKRIREDLGLIWAKQIPEPLRRLLTSKNVAPNFWEDSPEGTLTGVCIIVAAWIANQAAQKSRDNPADSARDLFENSIRPLIAASMDVGIKLGQS